MYQPAHLDPPVDVTSFTDSLAWDLEALAVIGGNTINFVGLGGCRPEDYVSADLPGYCSRRVLQNPTMWLGIFTGGYDFDGSFLIMRLLIHLRQQNTHSPTDAIPDKGCYSDRHIYHLYHFLALPHGRHLLSPHTRWR